MPVLFQNAKINVFGWSSIMMAISMFL